MQEEIVRIESVSKDFPGVAALCNINLSLKTGEIHGVVGENGAGKSTLINILAGVYPPTSGSLFINGEKVNSFHPSFAQSLGIAVVYQETVLVPDFTAEENIWLGRESSKYAVLDKNEQKKRTKLLCKEYGINIPLSLPVSSFRVAEQKLVEILRALSMKSKVFIFDEPTEALSQQDVEKLFKILSTLKSLGFAILYVSHHLEEVFRICDRITILRNGEEVGCYLPNELSTQSLIQLITNRDMKDQYPVPPKDVKMNPLLQVENLSNPVLGLLNISFHINTGEVVAFFGMVGSHRSELMKCLFGAARTKSGNIIFNGQKIRFHHPQDAIKVGIFLCPEDRKTEGLIADMSVLDNCSLPFLSHFSRIGIVRKALQKDKVKKLILDLSIKTPSVNQKATFLSGGNQQKIVLGKWLIGNKGKLFIFDEPTKGIDVGTKMDIYKTMQNLAREGAGVIFVSSDIRELLGVSDRLYVMRKGGIAGEYERKDFDQQTILLKALTEEKTVGVSS
ncbi:putative ribose/galactose/methyl galactoside import ATP-binding protein [uncultured spirochete]|uniref:Putative ribose/galactose/methyl galactoside import ATP-binding protein n=1 Tax=uncultured spirochete TaxID=156406 RepID=A0A3P3XPK8_9SPIR|nr:putative ribose/galactose/methyl galactoside import ATP-binding protein [uncultured spirochete]